MLSSNAVDSVRKVFTIFSRTHFQVGGKFNFFRASQFRSLAAVSWYFLNREEFFLVFFGTLESKVRFQWCIFCIDRHSFQRCLQVPPDVILRLFLPFFRHSGVQWLFSNFCFSLNLLSLQTIRARPALSRVISEFQINLIQLN